ncbi:MAG: 50S ribosomal protein L24 [Verrucomicrobiia bacterium]
MKKRFHVKKDDEVAIISGAHKGQKGKVLQVLTKKDRVIVEGVNLVKKAVRASQNNPKGGFEEKEGAIHISNVRLVQPAAVPAKK